MKTAFIGHRQIFAKDIYKRLLHAIEAEIEKGCTAFTMGTHGAFDRLALSACRELRCTHADMEIEVVLTSLNALKKHSAFEPIPYADVKTVLYEIESAHYKQRIGLSNRRMIDGCDTLICYVDRTAYGSGAKSAFLYAEKHGKRIVNLYREEDVPFYGMTKEEIDAYIQAFLSE